MILLWRDGNGDFNLELLNELLEWIVENYLNFNELDLDFFGERLESKFSFKKIIMQFLFFCSIPIFNPFIMMLYKIVQL